MSPSPLLLLHICSAIVGLLSGFLAASLRKGSGWHGAAGNVFFVSMLSMSASAGYLAAFHSPNALNLVVSLLTFYLVSTAWRAARHRDGKAGLVDLIGLLFILGVGTAGLGWGFEAANSPRGSKDGMPAAIYFIFGSIALLCAVSDIRMLVRGGVFGAHRIARHLWRMCLALLIATLSFFPGQARQLPDGLRQSKLLFVPHILLAGSMIYWRSRVLRRRKGQQTIGVTKIDAIVEQTQRAMRHDQLPPVGDHI